MASPVRQSNSGQAPEEPSNSDPEVRASIRILVVDDDRPLRETTAIFLGQEGYSVTTCGRGDEALELVKRRKFDIVMFDLFMSQVPGIELLKACLVARRETIVIMMTGNPSVATNVEALELGAWDYLPKPFSATHLQLVIGRAAHTVLLARKGNAEGEAEKSQASAEQLSVLGRSPSFRKVIELARKVALTDASVFITGESGTGKELIAQFIHSNSRRNSRTFIPVNCAALPEMLLESEMFGHRKGAFTGAIREKPGLLEAANGGTLFLDELIEMSMPVQAKLLRVIQDGVVRRVGSEATDAVVNVRFIAATNRDPGKAVTEGLLRQDLLYRLRVVPLHVPPLRERPEDLPLLANHFLRHFWNQHRDPGAPVPHLSEATIRALRAHSWPGNVRELQNVFEHAVVIMKPGSVVQPSDIPFIGEAAGLEGADAEVLAEPLNGHEYTGSPISLQEAYPSARDRLVSEFELRYLTALIRRAHGNMSRASRLAGIDRATLYRLMDKHGLQRESVAFGDGQ